MYKIIGAPTTRTMRVIWFMEELGLPYELNPALPQSEEARHFNPVGKVPALILENGVVLYDSLAICMYLAEKQECFTTLNDPIGKAQERALAFSIIDDLDAPLAMIARHTSIYPEHLRVPAAVERTRQEIDRGLDRLSLRLGDKPYLMGESFTVADIMAGHCLNWALRSKITLPAGAVAAYFKRISERPAFQRTLEIIAKGNK